MFIECLNMLMSIGIKHNSLNSFRELLEAESIVQQLWDLRESNNSLISDASLSILETLYDPKKLRN